MSSPLLRRSVPFVLAGAGALGLIAWAPAQDKGKPEKGLEHRERGEEEELEGLMNQMKAEVRALSKGINAENRDKSLERIANFERAVLGAKLQTPPNAEGLEGDKKTEFMNGFRKKLIEVL